MSYIGTSKIGKMFLGDTEIAKVYLGSNLVYQNKPYDAQVEYLESTGTQYIDTGITGDQDTKAIVEVLYYIESSIATSGRVLGSRTNSPNRIVIGTNNGRSSESTNNFAQFRSNTSHAASNVVFGVWRLMEVNPTGYYIDGVRQGSSFSASTFTTPQTMKLFAFDHNGVVGCGVVRIKFLKLFDGADLVRDFIPVRCGTTGYMYDKVSGELFDNSGTGDFILGPDVT